MEIIQSMKLILARAVVAAGTVVSVQAVNTDWIGGSGGDWSVGGNWSAGLPGGSDFARFSGTEGAVIGSGVSAEMWRMNLQGGNIGGSTTSSITIQPGGSLTTGVLPTGSSIAGINLNWGGSGGNSGSVINVAGGAFISQTVRTPGSSVAGQDITIAVTAGGSASMTTLSLGGTGSGSRTVSVDGSGSSLTVTGSATLDNGLTTATVSNGGFMSTGGLSLGAGTFNLDGGTLQADNVSIATGFFNWGDGTLTTRTSGASGGTDFTDPAGAASGPAVRSGTSLTFTGDLATGTGDTSDLDLGNLFVNGGVRVNTMTVSGDLNLNATGDSLTSIQGAYLLRPNTGTAIDFGEIPLITVGGNLTGEFDTFIAPGTDNLGFSEYTGAWTPGTSAASDLPLNTWYLEYDETADTVSFFYKVEGTVPEPSTVGLLALGLLFVRGIRKKQDPDWA